MVGALIDATLNLDQKPLLRPPIVALVAVVAQGVEQLDRVRIRPNRRCTQDRPQNFGLRLAFGPVLARKW